MTSPAAASIPKDHSGAALDTWLWDMAGYLLSELREYMTTMKTPGKEDILLVMFVTMSKQLATILKTKGAMI